MSDTTPQFNQQPKRDLNQTRMIDLYALTPDELRKQQSAQDITDQINQPPESASTPEQASDHHEFWRKRVMDLYEIPTDVEPLSADQIENEITGEESDPDTREQQRGVDLAGLAVPEPTITTPDPEELHDQIEPVQERVGEARVFDLYHAPADGPDPRSSTEIEAMLTVDPVDGQINESAGDVIIEAQADPRDSDETTGHMLIDPDEPFRLETDMIEPDQIPERRKVKAAKKTAKKSANKKTSKKKSSDKTAKKTTKKKSAKKKSSRKPPEPS